MDSLGSEGPGVKCGGRKGTNGLCGGEGAGAGETRERLGIAGGANCTRVSGTRFESGFAFD
jgi:hypothetical protein